MGDIYCLTLFFISRYRYLVIDALFLANHFQDLTKCLVPACQSNGSNERQQYQIQQIRPHIWFSYTIIALIKPYLTRCNDKMAGCSTFLFGTKRISGWHVLIAHPNSPSLHLEGWTTTGLQPTKQRVKLAKNFVFTRLSCLHSTILPRLSTPRIWNTAFAKSMPFVEIFMFDDLLWYCGYYATTLAHWYRFRVAGIHLLP